MASIPYKIVKRVVYVKNEKKLVYTPKISSTGVVSTKSLANQIAVESTISDNEAKRFINGFALVIREALANGFQVKLDKLGIFTPKITAKAVDSSEELTSDTITKVTVEYKMSTTVDKKLKAASFRKINLDIQHV